MSTVTPGVGTVDANAETVNRVASMCENTAQSLAEGMSQLMNQVDQLGGGGMNGQAYQAFAGVSGDLNRNLTTILNALDELAGKMSNASSQYGVHDGDAARTITNAASGDAATLLRG
jgi:WXG100 family type VII secretion target